MRTALLSCLVVTTAHSLRPSQYGNGVPNMAPPSSRAYNNQNNNNQNNNNQNNNQNTNRNDNSNRNLGVDGYSPPPNTNSFDQEQSVEERLASWRAQQQERYEGQNPIDELNPRDEEGRLKLLATVSRGSISVFFFIYMWRSVHHFELADRAFRQSPSIRLVLVVPTVLLFIGNMAGCVASVSTKTLRAKKRMKAILNLNKLVELLLFGYHVFRLVLLNNKLVQREVYVGRSLSNFLFIVQCQLFTRVTWDAAQVTHGSTEPRYGTAETDNGDYSRNNGGSDVDDNRFDYEADDNDEMIDTRYSERQSRTNYYNEEPNENWEGDRQSWND